MQRGKASGEGFGVVDATRVRGRAYGMDVYVTSTMIDDQVERLAKTLHSRFRPDENPLYGPILNGGAFFYHDLARALAREADRHPGYGMDLDNRYRSVRSILGVKHAEASA